MHESKSEWIHGKCNFNRYAERAMAFATIPGITGKVFTPDECIAGVKKHPCADCFGCQHCTDDRCAVCRIETGMQQTGRRRCMASRRASPKEDIS